MQAAPLTSTKPHSLDLIRPGLSRMGLTTPSILSPARPLHHELDFDVSWTPMLCNSNSALMRMSRPYMPFRGIVHYSA